MHSFRATLATRLRAAHVDHPNIPALCRWLCPDTADVYAALGQDTYAALLDKAYSASVTATVAIDLPDIDADALAVQMCENPHIDVEYNPTVDAAAASAQ